MKKICLLISALTMFLCGMIFTGCDGENDFIAPKNSWVYKKNSNGEYSFIYNYTKDSTTHELKFDAYIDYATTESSISFNTTNETIVEGVNVILIPIVEDDNESVWKELISATSLDKVCIFHSYGTSSTVQTSDTDSTGSTQSLSAGIWNLVYVFNNFEEQTDSSFTKLMKTYTELNSDSITNLNLKRVLYNMLGDRLFSE